MNAELTINRWIHAGLQVNPDVDSFNVIRRFYVHTHHRVMGQCLWTRVCRKPKPLKAIKSCDIYKKKKTCKRWEGEGRRVERGGEEWRAEGGLLQLCTRCFSGTPVQLLACLLFLLKPDRQRGEDSSGCRTALNNVRHANTTSSVA